MDAKRYSRNSKNGTSNDVYRRRPGSFNRNQGGKRQYSPEIEWRRSPRQRNVENVGDHEGRNWHDESRQFHQITNFILDPSTSTCSTDRQSNLDYHDVDKRQIKMYNELLHSSREFHQPPLDCHGADQNQFDQPRYNMMKEWVGSRSISPMGITSTSTGINPYPYDVSSDASMYGMMGPMSELCPMPTMNGDMRSMTPKCTINSLVYKTFPHCILVPPPPDAEPSTRRDRPPGCRTVFVGGLPEKANEQIMKEVFSDCGEINSVRMSRKSFCHIRFANEDMVEHALLFSGYRLIIKNRNGVHGNTGSRIHVDYANARDDEKDYESKMRILTREMCNREDLRPSSPKYILHYSEREAAKLSDNLRGKDTFEQGCKVLTTWLERGNCNKKNSGTFYSMIQSTYSHVKKLVLEKNNIEDELTIVQHNLHQQSTTNDHQFKNIEKVLQSASSQKVWDHFTKAQRKHIEQWRELTNLAKKQNCEDLLEACIEDEMEMSDSDDQKPSEEWTKNVLESSKNSIKEYNPELEEIELLRNQLQTANFEMAESNKKITALNDAYQLMQLNYLDTKKKWEEAMKDKMDSENGSNDTFPTAAISITENEARLVSLIGTFLIVHPFGASIDYICSYLAKMDKNICSRDVEHLLKKFNTVFKEESTGIGASLEKKWIFFGFNFYAVPHQNPFFNP